VLPFYVRFAPKADKWHDISTCPLSATSRHMQCGKTELLFDHLVGEREQLCRHIEAKRFGGL
jgi:hypothetical protein